MDGSFEAGDALALERWYGTSEFLWAISRFFRTIYKVDTGAREVVAGYKIGPEEQSNSYIATDRRGDAIVVAVLAGTVTKFSASLPRCPDRDHDGETVTSGAWNEVLPFDAADDWQDDCILWHAPVQPGSEAVIAYESVVDAEIRERLWVAQRRAQSFVELDSDTGLPTGREVATPGFEPHFATLDRDGVLWAIGDTRGTVMSFDAAEPDGTLSAHHNLPTGIFISVDEFGYVWLDGDNNLWRLDPVTDVAEPLGEPGWRDGIGLRTPDGRGGFWWAPIMGGEDFGMRVDTVAMTWEDFPLPDHGYWFGVDFRGQVWIMGTPHGAWVMDPDTRETTPALNQCEPQYCVEGSHNGDFTGVSSAVTRDEIGVWTASASACEDGDEVVWSRVRSRAALPAGSSVSIWVRTAADVGSLGAASWIRVGSLSDGDTELALQRLLRDRTAHRALSLQARLGARYGSDSPRVLRLELAWGCTVRLR